jgi:glycerol-1-phosphate dehydrogenase [NAD(P)+]
MIETIHNLPRVEMRPFESLEESRRALVVTSGPAWRAVAHRLHGLDVLDRVEVSGATAEAWDALAAGADLAAAEVAYAVGGGLAADAAKYMAARHGLALVVLPTALSVDAFLTATSGVRADGCVRYLPSKVPETLILDLDVVAAAPPGVRAAGITDVLSIATGCWDWQFAEEQGQNPPGMTFIPWVYDAAQAILRGALDCAEAAGRGDRDGLKALYDGLALEVQLCNQVGHARPEEGSEHYFAYAAENLTGHGLPHGDLVGPGILLAARLQGQDTRALEAALRACNVPLDRIAPEATAATLRDLPDYARRHRLPFGIAHVPEAWKAAA